jgi:hypothetical protein
MFRQHLDRQPRREPGLGDVVAGALKAVGVKKHPGCGCHQKQAALNAATPSWMRLMLGRLARPFPLEKYVAPPRH